MEHATHLDAKLKDEIIWLLNTADRFSDKRNDAIHTPFIPANAVHSWSLVADLNSQSPRVRKLWDKDILKEFKWYVDYTRALSGFAYQLRAPLGHGKPLPDRPVLPHLGQSRTRKRSRRKNIAKLRVLRRGSSQVQS